MEPDGGRSSGRTRTSCRGAHLRLPPRMRSRRWLNRVASCQCFGVGETCLYILTSEVGVHVEELSEIGVVGQLPEYVFDSDARASDHRLTDEDVGIYRNA